MKNFQITRSTPARISPTAPGSNCNRYQGFRPGLRLILISLQVVLKRDISWLFGIQKDTLKKGVGAVFKEHRLVPIKVNPIRNGLCVEGDGVGLVGREDEEAVTRRNVVGGEGNLHTIVDSVKDL